MSVDVKRIRAAHDELSLANKNVIAAAITPGGAAYEDACKKQEQARNVLLVLLLVALPELLDAYEEREQLLSTVNDLLNELDQREADFADELRVAEEKWSMDRDD